MSYTVLINRNSGTILKEGRKKFAARLLEALGEDLRYIDFLNGKQMAKALRLADINSKLLIGGGDGTIATAATILGAKKIPFGILPLGTMNLFAKDLNLPVDPYECAKLYKNHETVAIDMATVNGRAFLCNAMLGAGVSIAAQREAERDNKGVSKWLRLVRALIKKLGSDKLYAFTFHYEGQMIKDQIKSAIISNNKYTEEAGPQNSLKKGSLTDGKLSVYTIVTQGTMQSVGLLAKVALGFWQNDPGIENFDTPEVIVTNGNDMVHLLIDGEITKLQAPLVFKIHPKELQLYVPAREVVP